MINPHQITADFEKSLCEYTGAPFAVAVDNQSNALFLALTYCKINNLHDDNFALDEVIIPKCTYPSVPCEIIHAGFKVAFLDNLDYFGYVKDIEPNCVSGEYRLIGTDVWDSSLRFTSDMYRPGMFQCLSFTGPYKHLKLTKAGAILTDDETAYKWFKKARFSGRSECSYHVDNFDDNPVLGWNMYLPVEIAARGIQMMSQFYNLDGSKRENADLCLPYPDLSKFDLWK